MEEEELYAHVRKMLTAEGECLSGQPLATRISFTWKGGNYLGIIKPVYPIEHPSVVMLSRTPDPLPQDLFEAYQAVDPGRTHLRAQDRLNLEATVVNFVRHTGGELGPMTRAQGTYFEAHPLRVVNDMALWRPSEKGSLLN